MSHSLGKDFYKVPQDDPEQNFLGYGMGAGFGFYMLTKYNDSYMCSYKGIKEEAEKFLASLKNGSLQIIFFCHDNSLRYSKSAMQKEIKIDDINRPYIENKCKSPKNIDFIGILNGNDFIKLDKVSNINDPNRGNYILTPIEDTELGSLSSYKPIN